MLVYTGRPRWYGNPYLRSIPARGLGALNFPAIDAAIQKFEGWTAGSLSQRNNNPGNMVYASWMSQFGCSPGGAGGFAQCPTVEAGEQVLDYRVSQLVNQGSSIADLLRVWAGPQYPGNTQASYDAYVASVAADTGLSPTVPISQQQSSSDAVTGLETPDLGISLPDADVLLADFGSETNWPLIAAAAAGLAVLLYAIA